MKYVSIDIETTGLDIEKSQILTIGAVIEDTEKILPLEDLPRFYVAIKRTSFYGEPVAIEMNFDVIKAMNSYMKAETQDEKNDIIHWTGMQFLEEDRVVEEFYKWLCANGMVEDVDPSTPESSIKMITGMKHVVLNVAGKNFGTYDQKLLEKLPRWKQAIKVRQRILDPGILFVDWKNDHSIPSLDLCKERANVPGKVQHTALEDALDVIKLLRTKYEL